MKKPIGVKVLSTVIYIQLGIIILTVLLLILSTILSTNSFWHGFHETLFKAIGVKNPSNMKAAEYGQVTGQYSLPILLIILSLFYLKSKKYKALCIVLVIETIDSFKNIISFIVSAALLIIVLGDWSTRNYLKSIEKEHSGDESSVNSATKIE